MKPSIVITTNDSLQARETYDFLEEGTTYFTATINGTEIIFAQDTDYQYHVFCLDQNRSCERLEELINLLHDVKVELAGEDVDELAQLSAEFNDWLKQNGLPKVDAEQLLHDATRPTSPDTYEYAVQLTSIQLYWLRHFIRRWDKASK